MNQKTASSGTVSRFQQPTFSTESVLSDYLPSEYVVRRTRDGLSKKGLRGTANRDKLSVNRKRYSSDKSRCGLFEFGERDFAPASRARGCVYRLLSDLGNLKA